MPYGEDKADTLVYPLMDDLADQFNEKEPIFDEEVPKAPVVTGPYFFFAINIDDVFEFQTFWNLLELPLRPVQFKQFLHTICTGRL